MGKGDRKSKRGKIILGTYGVRRRRKKAGKPPVKLMEKAKETVIKEKKPLKHRKPAAEVQEVPAPVINEVVSEVSEQKPEKAPAVKKEKKAAAAEKPAKEVKEKKPVAEKKTTSPKTTKTTKTTKK
ncbi:MAG: 30S ribosomal protein THX [Bacteroidales bacterium]|nr:30S ribosomal protein THX [Bacteroidales bacterium]